MLSFLFCHFIQLHTSAWIDLYVEVWCCTTLLWCTAHNTGGIGRCVHSAFLHISKNGWAHKVETGTIQFLVKVLLVFSSDSPLFLHSGKSGVVTHSWLSKGGGDGYTEQKRVDRFQCRLKHYITQRFRYFSAKNHLSSSFRSRVIKLDNRLTDSRTSTIARKMLHSSISPKKTSAQVKW